jgi:two-component system sensor histidine kinase BarA
MHYDHSLIDADSYPGCQFLSIISPANQLEQNINPSEDSTVQHSNLPVVASDNAKNLLIVDDNPINLALACELTRLWGHDPQQASNANDAMKLFRSQDFDLILLDIQMPEIDGIQLMQMMREFKPNLAVPIVAITANVLEEEMQRLLKLGFDAYISKPIDEEKLQGLLNRKYPCLTQNTVESPHDDRAESVDYNLTRKLSANNIKLMKATFSMLQMELPSYVQEITQAIDAAEDKQISDITHKLKGVCCYAGLPELKSLLENYDAAKKIDKQAILAVCREIRSELQRIEDVLQQRSEAGV